MLPVAITVKQVAATSRLAARLAARKAALAAAPPPSPPLPQAELGTHLLVAGLVEPETIAAASAEYCALVDAEGSDTMEYGGAVWKASRTYADGGGQIRSPLLEPIFGPLLAAVEPAAAAVANGRELALESAFATLYDARPGGAAGGGEVGMEEHRDCDSEGRSVPISVVLTGKTSWLCHSRG